MGTLLCAASVQYREEKTKVHGDDLKPPVYSPVLLWRDAMPPRLWERDGPDTGTSGPARKEIQPLFVIIIKVKNYFDILVSDWHLFVKLYRKSRGMENPPGTWSVIFFFFLSTNLGARLESPSPRPRPWLASGPVAGGKMSPGKRSCRSQGWFRSRRSRGRLGGGGGDQDKSVTNVLDVYYLLRHGCASVHPLS